MEYQQAYKIAHEISNFFTLNFDGKQKAQMAQIILNNVNEKNSHHHKFVLDEEAPNHESCECGAVRRR